MTIILYLLAIITANVVTAAFPPLNIGIIVPWGTFCIGLTFVLRDFVQLRYGRKTAYYTIGSALGLSAITSSLLGDPLTIVAASAVSFAVSEVMDTEIFTRVKATIAKRIMYSGTVGGLLDSALFAIVGLVPAGFIPWQAVPMAILGQFVVKTLVQLLVAVAVGHRHDRTT